MMVCINERFSQMTQTWQNSFDGRQSHLMASPAVCAAAIKGTRAVICVKYMYTAKPPTP